MTGRDDRLDGQIGDEAPSYYFGYGIGPADYPSLEAVKTWTRNGKRHFDTLTVGEYGSFEAAAMVESELEWVLEEQGLESAMQLAEVIAGSGGYLDLERSDGRIFTRDDAPPDPFTTLRQEQLTEPHYSIGAVSANGQHFLDVMKAWGEDDYERLVIPQPDWQQALDTTMDARQLLDDGDLQSAMHRVELAGIRAGVINPDRDDPRLFTQGPPDPFETLAERLSDEINPFWRVEPEANMVESLQWQFEMLPAHSPDGDLLGHALHMVTPASDDKVQLLEMVHFETIDDARRFAEDFGDFVLPGVLGAAELAEEVARIEGHSTDWQTITASDLEALRTGQVHLIRSLDEWRVYQPPAEREPPVEVEGLNAPPSIDMDL